MCGKIEKKEEEKRKKRKKGGNNWDLKGFFINVTHSFFHMHSGFFCILRAVSGIVHAHHSCGRKQESCLGLVFRPFPNSHQYRLQIALRQMDDYAFSGQH